MTRYTKSMREALEEVWANDIAIEEGKMKTIATLFDQGKSAEEIAKKMKLPLILLAFFLTAITFTIAVLKVLRNLKEEI